MRNVLLMSDRGKRNIVETEPRVAGGILPIVADSVAVAGSSHEPLLRGVSLSVGQPGLTVVLGPNGAGKTVLMRTLAGLVRPASGLVRWNGRTPSPELSRKLGFVFQKPVLFRRTALQNIEFGLRNLGVTREDARQRAEQALAEAGLSALAEAPARRLSGGEQQRLAIARALALSPEVLFLDEPTAHLDPAATALIEAVVKATASRGVPVVHVTHDLAQARRLADRVVFLHRGEILDQQPADDFFLNPKSKVAGAYLNGELVW